MARPQAQKPARPPRRKRAPPSRGAPAGKRAPKPGRPPATPRDVEAQLDTFIGKFTPLMAARIRRVRAWLRRRFPRAVELVYDNYNFFVIGYSPTERPSDAICSLAADANGVGIAFWWGAKLADPHGLLHGAGKQNRFLRQVDAASLDDARVAPLFTAAEKLSPPMGSEGGTVVRSVSPKQRPRRK